MASCCQIQSLMTKNERSWNRVLKLTHIILTQKFLHTRCPTAVPACNPSNSASWDKHRYTWGGLLPVRQPAQPEQRHTRHIVPQDRCWAEPPAPQDPAHLCTPVSWVCPPQEAQDVPWTPLGMLTAQGSATRRSEWREVTSPSQEVFQLQPDRSLPEQALRIPWGPYLS